MKGAGLTRQQLMFYMLALPAASYHVKTIPEDAAVGGKLIVVDYDRRELLRSTKFLRAKNREGSHIYGRPNTTRHVLIDDLGDNGLAALIKDGLRPAITIRTSPGNYQAWVTVAPEDSPGYR